MKIHLFSITLSAALLAGCGHEMRQTQAAAEQAPVAVQATAAATMEWPATYEALGTVRARTATAISSKVMGYVREVRVQAGDRVREGQLLISVDARDLEAQYRRAEAGRQEAASAQPEVESAVAAAKAQLELAQATFRRIEDLFRKKSVSNQEFDEAGARLKAAQAGYQIAVAKSAQLVARQSQAEQERQAAGILRDYAQITAPFSGIVTARTVEPGVLATPGTTLLTIEREGAYRLEAAVEESRLASVRVGQSVAVSLDALDRSLTARVSEIVPAVDATSRAYLVKIDLPASPQLRSGIFGRALFPVATRQVLALPQAAVQERGQLQSVLVAEEGIARTRLVTTGARANGQVEVLSGLSAGEKVIFPAPPGLGDGARVEVRP
jgi:RND family efflux transporter MFP subunit